MPKREDSWKSKTLLSNLIVMCELYLNANNAWGCVHSNWKILNTEQSGFGVKPLSFCDLKWQNI